MRFLPTYGLVILMVALIILFSLLLPRTFPTMFNLRAIVSDKSIIALLSLAAMIPMAAGRIDLTVGYGIVLWHILAISLQTLFGFPFPLAVMTVILLGALTGFLNGMLIELARIDSFVATLGTGTVLYSIALWQTGGRQMVRGLPDGFYSLSNTFVLGLPIPGYYVLAVSVALWVILEYTPVGRYPGRVERGRGSSRRHRMGGPGAGRGRVSAGPHGGHRSGAGVAAAGNHHQRL
jgi:ribose transport system permease protein